MTIIEAREVAQRLRELDNAKKHHPSGPGGQMMGSESYRLVANGFAFQVLQDGADTIESLYVQLNQAKAEIARARADERQAMSYLSEIRKAMGSDCDFPALVEAVNRLQSQSENMTR